jgi:hypothetical protein
VNLFPIRRLHAHLPQEFEGQWYQSDLTFKVTTKNKEKAK